MDVTVSCLADTQNTTFRISVLPAANGICTITAPHPTLYSCTRSPPASTTSNTEHRMPQSRPREVHMCKNRVPNTPARHASRIQILPGRATHIQEKMLRVLGTQVGSCFQVEVYNSYVSRPCNYCSNQALHAEPASLKPIRPAPSNTS